jgi:hypothetical protein
MSQSAHPSRAASTAQPRWRRRPKLGYTGYHSFTVTSDDPRVDDGPLARGCARSMGDVAPTPDLGKRVRRAVGPPHVASGEPRSHDFYGIASDSCRAIWARFAARDPVVEVVRFHGFVSRRLALQAVADSDAALVMLGSGPGMGQFVPGKLFDYIGQSKEVLAVLPPGDARDILNELRWGVVADPTVTDIGLAVERLMALPAPARVADPEGRYDRIALAARLADCLRHATGDTPREREERGTE